MYIFYTQQEVQMKFNRFHTILRNMSTVYTAVVSPNQRFFLSIEYIWTFGPHWQGYQPFECQEFVEWNFYVYIYWYECQNDKVINAYMYQAIIRNASANTQVKCINEKGGGGSNIPFPMITGSVDVLKILEVFQESNIWLKYTWHCHL